MKQSDLPAIDTKLAIDILSALSRRSRGQANRGGKTKLRPDLRQPRVVGAKIMPPLAHTVCLVHSQQRDRALLDRLAKLTLSKTFRRHIDQSKSSGCQFLISSRPSRPIKRGVDQCCIDPAPGQ